MKREPVELSALDERQLALDAPLSEQRNHGRYRPDAETPPSLGTPLPGRVGNLLSNASLYRRRGQQVRVVRLADGVARP